MPGKKKRVEEAAERTGEAVERDVKKGAKAVSNFGKGIKKRIKKEDWIGSESSFTALEKQCGPR